MVFQRRDTANLTAYCSCAAGENGLHCKHRVRILCGLVEGIVSDNHQDVNTVAGWIAGTDVEIALRVVINLEREAERIKKDLSAAKRILSRALHD